MHSAGCGLRSAIRLAFWLFLCFRPFEAYFIGRFHLIRLFQGLGVILPFEVALSWVFRGWSIPEHGPFSTFLISFLSASVKNYRLKSIRLARYVNFRIKKGDRLPRRPPYNRAYEITARSSLATRFRWDGMALYCLMFIAYESLFSSPSGSNTVRTVSMFSRTFAVSCLVKPRSSPSSSLGVQSMAFPTMAGRVW